MSSQGTGSLLSHDFERLLLDSWGAWSRSGDLGLGYGRSGYAPLELFIKSSGIAILFSVDDIMMADGVICALPPMYNATIKTAFLHQQWSEVRGEEVSAAVTAFSESLSERISDRR